MRRMVHVKLGLGVVLGSLALGGVLAVVVSCGTAPTPFIVQGAGSFGNEVPTITIIEPNADFTFGQGDPFVIRWTDTDRDDNAQISFSLISVDGPEIVTLVTNLDENDLIGPDSFTVPTSLVPPGTYNLVGTIDDGINAAVSEFALVEGAAVQQRLEVTIVEPGQGPQTVPPSVFVTEPAFDLSVSQEDILAIRVQPTVNLPNINNPFDPDSDIRIFIILDLDEDPENDDPDDPDPAKIIVLRDLLIAAGTFDVQAFDIRIDLEEIPPRDNGEPYHIRATVDDATNPPVHHYAAGAISVVRLAAGTVDLGDIGRSLAGAKVQGFNPSANVGSRISGVSDFDADGTDDFVIVAQFGNPQNVGPVGEAYLIYGIDGTRLGGTIPVNSISVSVSGVVFEGPPVRTSQIPIADAQTDGITDVSFVPDLTGDGRPELLFGLSHVHGAWDSTDHDPGDDDVVGDIDIFLFGCYPDLFLNNFTDTPPGCLFHLGCNRDRGYYAGGMAVIVNSTNRDSNPTLTPAPPRLDTTTVTLELVGQLPTILTSDTGAGNMLVRAHNTGVGNLGSDPDEESRIAGFRIVPGSYVFNTQDEPPRQGLWGQTVRSIGDMTADGVPEIIISAPRNERFLADLEAEFGLFGSAQWISTPFKGSVTVIPGTNYNTTVWRDIHDATGTSRLPFFDNNFGSCTSAPPQPRQLFTPAETFGIFAEHIDDMLGDAQSAGDFNRDGLTDILCGAPLNDRTGALPDTGTMYIIYGRIVTGDIQLSNADDPVLRPPMLRLRGLRRGDQIGWRQAATLDVNGDGIDDIVVSSPRTDFGSVPRASCGGDFDGDGVFDVDDLSLVSFNSCDAIPDDDLFSNDACAVAFDYDHDGDVDDDDRCVFCCLSTECVVEAACIFGREADCCANLVDNGFVGVVFGGQFIDGDRTLAQLATSQLPGAIFFGNSAGDRAGFDVSSARDFNQDGFGDLLIVVPGEVRVDSAGRERLGVVYLVFGGTHLTNAVHNLQDVGTEILPGIVFLSPYEKGRPNEAAPRSVAFLGDINNDGFGDIAIGNPKADFVDPAFPQDPSVPPSDASTGRRSDVGEAYLIYGNNFGTNRALAP